MFNKKTISSWKAGCVKLIVILLGDQATWKFKKGLKSNELQHQKVLHFTRKCVIFVDTKWFYGGSEASVVFNLTTWHHIFLDGLYGNIYHQYTPNVSVYTTHGFPWIRGYLMEKTSGEDKTYKTWLKKRLKKYERSLKAILPIFPSEWFQLGLSENRVYSQWNSHLIGIMIINQWVYGYAIFRHTQLLNRGFWRCWAARFSVSVLQHGRWNAPVLSLLITVEMWDATDFMGI